VKKKIIISFKVLFISIWATGISVLMIHLMSFHFAPLNINSTKVELFRSNKHGNYEQNTISAFHVLSEKCTCSERLIHYLTTRKKQPNINEIVYLIEGSLSVKDQLLKSGFEVVILSEEDAVDQFSIEALPLFIVKDGGKSMYVGGYSYDQKHSKLYQDLEILKNIKSSLKQSPYPVIGCSNGQISKKKFDILGVKYVTSK
jgi:hypothetical protein